MNALQSLSTAGVHARRCSGVPCEKDGAGDAVADSKPAPRATVLEASAEAASIYSGFPRSSEDLPSVLIRVDTNTLLPEPVLVAKCQPLELSTPLQSLRFPKVGVRRIGQDARPSGPVDSASGAQTAKSAHVRPIVGNHTNATVAC
jgi:hypothetical protein